MGLLSSYRSYSCSVDPGPFLIKSLATCGYLFLVCSFCPFCLLLIPFAKTFISYYLPLVIYDSLLLPIASLSISGPSSSEIFEVLTSSERHPGLVPTPFRLHLRTSGPALAPAVEFKPSPMTVDSKPSPMNVDSAPPFCWMTLLLLSLLLLSLCVLLPS